MCFSLWLIYDYRVTINISSCYARNGDVVVKNVMCNKSTYWKHYLCPYGCYDAYEVEHPPRALYINVY